MENPNAEQVKKWLEICAEDTPYPDQSQALLDAIALINSQEQRIGAQDMTISELRKRVEKAEHDADRYAQRIKEFTEENERLKSQKYMVYSDGRIEALGHDDPKGEQGKCGLYKQCQTDTVRKMQERLKKKSINHSWGGFYVPNFMIDQIAKEMLEGEE